MKNSVQYVIFVPSADGVRHGKPMMTHWFDPKNHWLKGMVVVDIINYKFMVNGKTWQELPVDHL